MNFNTKKKMEGISQCIIVNHILKHVIHCIKSYRSLILVNKRFKKIIHVHLQIIKKLNDEMRSSYESIIQENRVYSKNNIYSILLNFMRKNIINHSLLQESILYFKECNTVYDICDKLREMGHFEPVANFKEPNDQGFWYKSHRIQHICITLRENGVVFDLLCITSYLKTYEYQMIEWYSYESSQRYTTLRDHDQRRINVVYIEWNWNFLNIIKYYKKITL